MGMDPMQLPVHAKLVPVAKPLGIERVSELDVAAEVAKPNKHNYSSYNHPVLADPNYFLFICLFALG